MLCLIDVCGLLVVWYKVRVVGCLVLMLFFVRCSSLVACRSLCVVCV